MLAVRIIIIVVSLGALVYFGTGRIKESSLRKEFNSIIEESINSEQYEEAIKSLEVLESRGGSADLQQEIARNKALCYFRWAQDPGLSGEKTLEYVKLAFSLDPELEKQHKDDYPSLDDKE